MMRYSPMERVMKTLNHEEPDRVPLFLMLTYQGANWLNMDLKTYFSKGEYVAEGQLRLRERYGHDCLNPFFYASVEIEAFGGQTLFRKEGPPNAGAPIIRSEADIHNLRVPEVYEHPRLAETLKAIRLLKEAVGDEVPIMGAVMAPFSLPIMQMGFEAYMELIYDSPALFWKLMAVNEAFAVAYANAQLEAGATAIGYGDPCGSHLIFPRALYEKTGFEIAKRVMNQIKGPTGYALASAGCLGHLDLISQTGVSLVAASHSEDMGLVKAKLDKSCAVIGNLNGIAMCHWDEKTIEAEVKKAIAQAGRGGGFVLSDGAGDVPLQVMDETLLAVSRAVAQWGEYPLDWVNAYD